MLIWMHAFALLLGTFKVSYTVGKKGPLIKKKKALLTAAAVSDEHTYTFVLL